MPCPPALAPLLRTLVLALCLAGCGGGAGSGGSGGGGSGGGGSGYDFDSLLLTLALAGSAQDPLTPAADMPVAGTARYEGAGAYSSSLSAPQDILARPDSVSHVTADVDFGAGSVTGLVTDFHAANGTPMSGSLILGDGRISGNAFSGRVSGRLIEGGTPVDYDGIFLGGFLDADAGRISGLGTATISVGGTVTGESNGVFVAVRR